MNSAWFEILVCQHCGTDLVGRACDQVVFCTPCRLAWLTESNQLRPLEVVSLVPHTATAWQLPFWFHAGIAAPAFLTARPISVMQIVTRIAARHESMPSFSAPAPLGARLPVSTHRTLTQLAGLPSGPSIQLLSVPIEREGSAFWLPGRKAALYGDDVIEHPSLSEALASVRD